MPSDPKEYDVFKLTRTINPVLQKGMQGVILYILDKTNFIAEFVKDDGTNYEFEGQFTFDLTVDDILLSPTEK